jgi:hypothetical protein
MSGGVGASAVTHPVDWWEQFGTSIDRIDEAILTTGLVELLVPAITAPLLQREADIAADITIQYRNKPSSDVLLDRYTAAAGRLRETIDRLRARVDDPVSLAEAEAVCLVIDGRYAQAAAASEARFGAIRLLRVFVSALRVAHLDVPVTAQLLAAGRTPAEAIHAGRIIGRYGWWPDWMRALVVERATTGALTDEFVAALDTCAFATLRSTQARLAKLLLRGDRSAVITAARTLDSLGETGMAARLRAGDLNAVAFAARFASV